MMGTLDILYTNRIELTAKQNRLPTSWLHLLEQIQFLLFPNPSYYWGLHGDTAVSGANVTVHPGQSICPQYCGVEGV
jgi:hypothetical protein